MYPAGDYHDEGMLTQKHSGVLRQLQQVSFAHTCYTHLLPTHMHTHTHSTHTFTRAHTFAILTSDVNDWLLRAVGQEQQALDLYGVMWRRIPSGSLQR